MRKLMATLFIASSAGGDTMARRAARADRS